MRSAVAREAAVRPPVVQRDELGRPVRWTLSWRPETVPGEGRTVLCHDDGIPRLVAAVSRHVGQGALLVSSEERIELATTSAPHSSLTLTFERCGRGWSTGSALAWCSSCTAPSGAGDQKCKPHGSHRPSPRS